MVTVTSWTPQNKYGHDYACNKARFVSIGWFLGRIIALWWGIDQGRANHEKSIIGSQGLTMSNAIDGYFWITNNPSLSWLISPSHYRIELIQRLSLPDIEFLTDIFWACLTVGPLIKTIFIKLIHILKPFIQLILTPVLLKNTILPELLLDDKAAHPILKIFSIERTALFLQLALTFIAELALECVVVEMKGDMVFDPREKFPKISQVDVVMPVFGSQEESNMTFLWFMNPKFYLYFYVREAF